MKEDMNELYRKSVERLNALINKYEKSQSMNRITISWDDNHFEITGECLDSERTSTVEVIGVLEMAKASLLERML